MVLTETILAVVVGLVVVSIVIGWLLLQSRAGEQASGRDLQINPAALEQLDRLAEELSTSGPQRTARGLVVEALNLLFEKYKKPPIE